MTTLYCQLSENWFDYDERKRNGGGDPLFFSCDAVWEVLYLLKRINALFPSLSEITILETIASGCQHGAGQVERKQFLLYVLHALELQLKEAE